MELIKCGNPASFKLAYYLSGSIENMREVVESEGYAISSTWNQDTLYLHYCNTRRGCVDCDIEL